MAWMMRAGLAAALGLTVAGGAEAGGCHGCAGAAPAVEFVDAPHLYKWRRHELFARKLRYKGHAPYSYDPDAYRHHRAQVSCTVRQPVYDRYGLTVGYHRIASVC